MALISCGIRLHFLDLFIEEGKIWRKGANLRELPFVTFLSGTKAEVSSSSSAMQPPSYTTKIKVVRFLRFHLALLSG